MAFMETVRPRVSYSDLQRAPEDGRRYELYDGEVFVVPSPLLMHQRATREILRLLDTYARRHGGEAVGSPIDIVFTEYDVLQPDVVFFEASRTRYLRPDEPIRVPPDLAVEVLSPSTEAGDRGKKMQIFARFGVREHWIVDPVARRVEVYQLAENAYVLAQTASETDIVRSTILPALEFPVAAIFA